MPITFHPDLGQVLYCDFTGFEEPEMVKNRPVVVLSRKKHSIGLCTIVPLSGSKPNPELPFHHKMSSGSLPESIAEKGDWWAKCDMVTTLAFRRFDRVKCGKDPSGKRLYSSKKISEYDLRQIQKGVLYAICLDKDLIWRNGLDS
jgi:uncharacterized protein YifN (PemK superfamily)